jgi:hypothetical protein
MVSDVRPDTQPQTILWQNVGMRLRTVAVFGIGYLLGTKAGRDRYEQLRRLYRRASSNERVRQVIDQGKDIVDAGTAQMRDIAADQLRHAGAAMRDRSKQ